MLKRSGNLQQLENKEMKIYFGDLAYLNNDSLPIPVPLNAGFIASYVLKHLSVPVNIKIFKDPDKLLDTVYSDAPDVLALTHYGWNANLNMAIVKKCQKDFQNLKHKIIFRIV